jgi:Sel1 repeat
LQQHTARSVCKDRGITIERIHSGRLLGQRTDQMRRLCLALSLLAAAIVAPFSVPAYGQEKTPVQKINESFNKLRQAAEQGDANAQFRLGTLYYKGQGVAQDYAEAARWYRKAAGQGQPEAQCYLGSLYALGQGVAQDYAEAVRWFRKAADAGNVDAQKALGVMYERGLGVPRDHAGALLWYRKAAGLADQAAPSAPPDWRRRVGPLLRPDQIDSLLSMEKLPAGLYLQDTQQALGNAANDLNYQNPWLRAGNHTGFAVWLYEPKAWLGAKKEVATRRFQTYREEDAPEDDRFQVLRVIVRPDTPEYLTAFGAANANNADHVVLRSIDKAQVAQPVSLEPTTEQFWSALGARASFAGLFAIFSMADVERIRSASPNRQFLVTIVGARNRSNRDFTIKAKHFQRLGD